MTAGTRVFLRGDSGYFGGFKTIGERFGPFALGMVEHGAHDADWSCVQMQPEQSLQAHIPARQNVNFVAVSMRRAPYTGQRLHRHCKHIKEGHEHTN